MLDRPAYFNPLDRGNLYQIKFETEKYELVKADDCFNPLDRGNLYQMSSLYEGI